MFPRYDEILDMVNRQVHGNYLYEPVCAATTARIHADITYVLNILMPGQINKIDLDINSYQTTLTAKIKDEKYGEYDVYSVLDWETRTFYGGYK